MARAHKSASAAVREAIEFAARNPPKKSWFARLPAVAQQDLLDIKQRFAAGEYENVDLAVLYRGVANRCREKRWPIPKSPDTVIRWLRQR